MAARLFSRYAVYIVPAIMACFFARNLVLTRTSHMDAWMGGAFRMFSSVDKMLYRVAGFSAQDDGETVFVNLRNIETMHAQDEYLRVMPSDARLKKVLAQMRETEWCRDSVTKRIEPLLSRKRGVTPVKLEIASISVYKPVFEKEQNTIRLELLNEYPAK